MKKAIVFQTCYLIEVDDSEISNKGTREALRKKAWQALPDDDFPVDESHTAQWYSSREILLDPEKMNCGKCAVCGGWTTDQEKPNPMEGLGNGATVDGKLLCDECLPSGHPWAF